MPDDPLYRHRWDREEIGGIVNQAAEMILEDKQFFPIETSRAIAARSLIDLMVNTTMTLLDNRSATLDQVMDECWQPEEEHQTAHDMVREWIGDMT